jgi:Deoxynucleoside kinase
MASAAVARNFILMFVDGNIGSGKSTFMRSFEADLTFLEPIAEWKPYLAKIYSNDVTHAHVVEFQHVVAAHYEDVLTRLESAIMETTSGRWTVAIVERNPMSGLYVFGARVKDSTLPGFQEWHIPILATRYQQMERRIERLHRRPFGAQVISLFLDPPTSFCVQNIHARNDPNASKITGGGLLDMLGELYRSEYATTFFEDQTMQKTLGLLVRVDSSKHSPTSLGLLMRRIIETIK